MLFKKMFLEIRKKKTIIIFAFLYSILIFSLSPINLPISDSAGYADIGKNLIKEGCFCSNSELQIFRAPLYPLMIAFFMLISGEMFMKLLPSVVSFFLIVVSFCFSLKITGSRKTALLTSVLFAFLPLVFYNSMQILSDILFTLFTITAFWMYVRFLEDSSNRNLVPWSIFTAFAFFTRFTAVLLIPVFFFHFIFAKNQGPGRVRMKKFLSFLLIILIILTPWIFWRASVGPMNEAVVLESRFTNTFEGFIRLEMIALENGKPLNANNIAFEAVVPVQVINTARIALMLLIFLTPFVSIFFVYVAYMFLRKDRDRGSCEFLLFVWVFTFLLFHTMFPYSVDSRYLLPIALPLTILFADRVSGIENQKLFALFITAQLIISFSIIYVDSQSRWTRIQTEVFQNAGFWLRDNTPLNSTVFSLGAPVITYYSERLDVGAKNNPDYVIESNFVPSMGIENFMNQTDQRFFLVKEFSDKQYYVKIYRKA